MRSKLLFLVISAILSVGMARAQWAPVVGKLQQIREVRDASGKVLERTVKRGNYFRSEDGSTLRQWVELNGTPTDNVMGELVDNNSGINYQVRYQEKRAAVQFRGAPVRSDMYSSQRRNSIGEDSVAGVDCSILPVKDDASGRIAGKLCVALDYGLVLRIESSGTRADGANVRLVTEFSDLHINSVPDPKLFDVRQFSVVELSPVAR